MTKEGTSKWSWEGICLGFFVYLSGKKLQSQRAGLALLGNAAVNPQSVSSEHYVWEISEFFP